MSSIGTSCVVILFLCINMSFVTVLAQCPYSFCGIYYSPAIIGQDPHVRKIDIYTDFFHNLHQRDLRLIKEIGATHVVVSENWAADGSTVHAQFLGLLQTFKLGLVVTFAIPMQNDAAERDAAKSSFKRLVTEFYDPEYAKILWGFTIPSPTLDKMSTDDVNAYFSLVNELIILNGEAAYFPKNPPNVTAGFPLNSRDGTVPHYCTPPPANPNAWLLDVYGGVVTEIGNSDFLSSYSQSFTAAVPPVIVVVKTQSYNLTISDESFQVSTYNTIANYIKNNNVIPEGIIFYEFSDEWWRSDLSTVGIDPEGCPNSNAYAHTSCGINTIYGVFSLEYSGLFRLRDIPLGYCIVPKEIVCQLKWSKECNIDVNVPICTGITQVVPYITYPILAGLSLIVFVLLFVLPVPKPPQIVDRQLQYFADDDLDRTHLDPNASSVNGSRSPDLLIRDPIEVPSESKKPKQNLSAKRFSQDPIRTPGRKNEEEPLLVEVPADNNGKLGLISSQKGRT